MHGADPAAFEAAISEAWGPIYTQWKKDQSATEGGKAASLFTDEWMNQRAQLLERKNYFGTTNASYDSSSADAYGADKATLYDGEDIVWEDRSSALKIRRGGTTESTKYVTFNNDNGGQLNGGRREDYLFGGAGVDTLVGLGGNDYLQGNAGDDVLDGGTGNDMLQGGLGDDAYIFNGDWGVDEVIDSDGVGSIVVDGHTLVGGRFVSAGAWISEDGKWRYALNERGDLIISNAEKSGRIVIRNYADSQSKSTSLMKNAPADVLGLTLPDSGQPWVNTAGMYALQGDQFGGTDSSWRIQPDGSIPGAQADPDANNLFDGSSIYPDVVVRPVGGNLGADGVWQPVYANTQAVGYWGRGGNDFISGEQYEDYLDGGDGDDAIWGGAGSDIIYGGKGNDIIVTNMAATMPGGFGELPRGADEIKGPDNVVTQTSGSNITRWFVVRSTDGSRVRVERAHVKNPDGGEFYAPESASDQDFVDAGEGDDYVWGGRGADYLIGGAGDDHLAGLAGSDVILGGDGKDVIYGDEWVRMRLQAVSSSTNGDLYASLPYDDTLKSPALHGDDVIDGGAGDDEVWGDGGNDSIWGGGGNDLLLGDALIAQLPYENHGNDQLDGGDGNDVLMGMGKDDALRGGSGNDELWGDHSSLDAQYHGSDLLDGGEGDDKLFGQGGSDTLHAGSGNDWLAGEDELAVDATSALTGDDILYGGDGNDTVIGGNGNDQLFGDEGDDWLYGGAGNDALDGGSGLNSLEGGAGNDTYTSASATGTDVIVDSEGDETYQIDFRALSAGASVDIDDQDGIGRIVIDGVVIQGDNIKAVAETAWEAAGCLLTRSGGDLLIRAKGGSGRALVYDYFNKSSMLGLTLPAYVPPVDPGGPTNPGGNSPPVVEILLGSQNLIEGLEFSLLLPANTFSDPDGDSLVLNASLPDGSALPAWLTFDPATGKFTGTPPLGSSASLNVVLKATDSAGASVSQDFSIIIEKPAGQNITGTNNDDVLDGSSGDDAFHGLAGNDVLNGGGGNDIFDGGDGNDILNGGDGDNIFNGGSGNDIINPHASIGNSKFVFGIGDGNDVVNANLYNFKTNNIIEFKDGISPADVDVSMSGVYGESYNSLIFSVKGNDSIAFKGAFYSYEKDIGNPRNQFKFSDGTIWDLHTVLLMAARKKSTDGYDEILGTLGDDVLSGGGGYDVIRGYDGNDFLYGDEDSDDLWGGYGNDVLHGGADNDYLYGQDGDDKMYGGDGDDRLRDIQGSNIFDGGAGNDRLEGGGRSKDVFLFGRGDGVDTVIDGAVRLSEVKFKAGINPDDIEVTRGRTDLKLSIRGSDDQINLLHFFNDIDPSDIASPVKQIVFENGTIWGLSEIEVLAGVYTNQAPVIEKIKSMNLLNGDSLYWSPSQENVYDDGGVTSFTVEMEDGSPLPSWMSLDVDGTLSGNVVANTNQTMRLKITATDKEGLSTSEILVINLSKAGITKRGTAAADTITGQGFADKLYGRAGNDQLFGMAGPDQLYGEDGNDTLTGGVGNDQLYGGNGSDKYIFFSGDGEDLIVEESSGSSTTDIVQLKDIASTDAYLLGRVGDDLHITIGSDVIMIRDQFALEASVIEEFHFKDNVVLLATDIQSQLDSGIKNGVVQNLMSESEKFVDTAAPIPMPKPNPLITSFEVDGAIPMPKLNPTIISQDELVMPAPGPLMTYVDKNGEHTRVKPLLIGATEELINLMSQSTDDRISLLDSISLASLLSQRLPNASSENSSIDGLVQAISAFNADAGAISSAPSSFAQTIDSLNRQSLSLAMNAA
ncbi:putative Ig domain-containing protein [Comamonas sp. MYb21]|uniref:putative Ig domain-containing protein n=1 Tax=Comamonas sp. MYb21 TaxID=1848648 RepID=UPI0030B72AEB